MKKRKTGGDVYIDKTKERKFDRKLRKIRAKFYKFYVQTKRRVLKGKGYRYILRRACKDGLQDMDVILGMCFSALHLKDIRGFVKEYRKPVKIGKKLIDLPIPVVRVDLKEDFLNLLNGRPCTTAKRMIEEYNFKKLRPDDARFEFFKTSSVYKDVIVPWDVMKMIFEFVPKTKFSIQRISIVNEMWYTYFLQTIERCLICAHNVLKIPYVVWKNLKSFRLCSTFTDLKMSHVKYLFKMIEPDRIVSFDIVDSMGNAIAPIFFNCLHNSKHVFINVTHMRLIKYHETSDRGTTRLSLNDAFTMSVPRCLPNLKHLVLSEKRIMNLYFQYSVFKRLHTFEVMLGSYVYPKLHRPYENIKVLKLTDLNVVKCGGSNRRKMIVYKMYFPSIETLHYDGLMGCLPFMKYLARYSQLKTIRTRFKLSLFKERMITRLSNVIMRFLRPDQTFVLGLIHINKDNYIEKNYQLHSLVYQMDCLMHKRIEWSSNPIRIDYGWKPGWSYSTNYGFVVTFKKSDKDRVVNIPTIISRETRGKIELKILDKNPGKILERIKKQFQ